MPLSPAEKQRRYRQRKAAREARHGMGLPTPARSPALERLSRAAAQLLLAVCAASAEDRRALLDALNDVGFR